MAPWPRNFDSNTSGTRIGGSDEESGGLRGGELFVVPDEIGRLLPARGARPIFIFDGHGHAERLNVLANLAEHPDARIVHLHERADALSGREPQHGYRARARHRVAIESHHAQGVAGERNPVHLGGARVEDMQQDALPLLDPERLAESHDLAVDRGDRVARVHRAVFIREQVAGPVMQGKKELLIVARGIVARFDHQKSVLSAVLRPREIVHRHGMGVIPAKAGGARRKGVAKRSSRQRWAACLLRWRRPHRVA